jgi:hypothetical protein
MSLASYPLKEALAADERLRCQLCPSGGAFKLYKSLEKHLKEVHKISAAELSDHWLHVAFLREKRKADSITPEELASVGLVYTTDGLVDEKTFNCKRCNKEFAKSSCLGHMTKWHGLEHGLDSALVRTWCCHKDGELIKKHHSTDYNQKHFRLTAAVLAAPPAPGGGDVGVDADMAVADEGEEVAAPPAPEGGEVGDDAGMALTGEGEEGFNVAECQVAGLEAVVPKFWVPTAKAASFSSGLEATLARLVDVLETSATASDRERKRGAEVEEPPPVAELNAEAIAWIGFGEAEVAARRNKWPLRANTDIDFSEFRSYLLKTKGLQAVSADSHIQKMQYFCGLLELPACGFSFVGLIAGGFKSGLLGSVFDLPILSPSLPTTRNIAAALSHFCDFLCLRCLRLNYTVAHRSIEHFRLEVLDPVKHKVHRARAAASARKCDWDAERLERLPPAEVLKAAISEAMLDLDTLWEAHRDDDCFPWRMKGAVNIIMLGLTYTNSYAGRPGEWEALTRRSAAEFIATGGDTLVVEHHKTEGSFGRLGRFVPSGNRQAMQKVLDLHGEDAVLFLDPAKAQTGRVNAAQLLKKFASVYTPGYQYPGPTLQRKFFHTKVEDEDHKGDALKVLCDMDGHSKKTGRGHYVLPNPKSDAKAAKSVFRNFAFEPVPWPSEEELADGRGRSLERLRTSFYRKSNLVVALLGGPVGPVGPSYMETASSSDVLQRIGIAPAGFDEASPPSSPPSPPSSSPSSSSSSSSADDEEVKTSEEHEKAEADAEEGERWPTTIDLDIDVEEGELGPVAPPPAKQARLTGFSTSGSAASSSSSWGRSLGGMAAGHHKKIKNSKKVKKVKGFRLEDLESGEEVE